MSVYLISGPSGSGKTTLGEELTKRGYAVIETDSYPGLSGYQHNETGDWDKSQKSVYPRTQEQLNTYSWNWDESVIQKILDENRDVIVFFVGGAKNESNFWDLFERRFALYVSDEVLVTRLQSREPIRWTNDSPELKKQLEWNQKSRDYFEASGATVLDSSKRIKRLADELLNIIKS